MPIWSKSLHVGVTGHVSNLPFVPKRNTYGIENDVWDLEGKERKKEYIERCNETNLTLLKSTNDFRGTFSSTLIVWRFHAPTTFGRSNCSNNSSVTIWIVAPETIAAVWTIFSMGPYRAWMLVITFRRESKSQTSACIYAQRPSVLDCSSIILHEP